MILTTMKTVKQKEMAVLAVVVARTVYLSNKGKSGGLKNAKCQNMRANRFLSLKDVCYSIHVVVFVRQPIYLALISKIFSQTTILV